MVIHAQEAAIERQRLNVRANLHSMRIAAVWQVLMPVAQDIENVTIATSQQHGCADITVSFSHAARERLQALADHIGKMSWVTDAALC
ncbi:hypothetical protein [Burkholderia sp. Ac-20353]|uniref:hypothetical protein n=1 Tax=Burkholderia sp. Ac-20353 TaxID=2703894 RepID=UPI00197B2C8E|nr:hypothetical protein [Burkholderia sp. Ac-20353]MBN3786074.1 hypothetical protein [Burkholderia sp. Ac-20353]